MLTVNLCVYAVNKSLRMSGTVFLATLTVEVVWSEAGLWSHIFPLLMTANGFAKATLQLQKALNRNDKTKFVTLFWMIWSRRNRKCCDTFIPSAFDVNIRTIENRDDWMCVWCMLGNSPQQTNIVTDTVK